MAHKLKLASLLLAVATLFTTAEAKTKKNPVVEASIPFTFQVGNRSLPAGKYKFELLTGSPEANDTMSVLAVRNTEARIFHAIAVPVNVDAGSAFESRAVFSDDDQHALVAVWENGSRLNVKPATLEATDNTDDWTGGRQLVNVSFRTSP